MTAYVNLARNVCAAALLGAHVAAQDITMDVGFATPLDSDYGVLATKFEELVEQYTDGAVDVKLRCCGQIATEDDAFKAMQLGTVDAYIVSQNNVSPHWPNMDVFVLPYTFQSTEHLVAVADGPVGDAMKEDLRAVTGVWLLTFGGPSYRDFFNSKRPIETMADMEGSQDPGAQERGHAGHHGGIRRGAGAAGLVGDADCAADRDHRRR